MKKIIIGIFLFFGIINISNANIDINDFTYDDKYYSASNWNSFGFSMSHDGVYLFSSQNADDGGGTSGDFIERHIMTIPFDISSASYYDRSSMGFNVQYVDFDFVKNGYEFLIFDANSNLVRTYSLTIPYDLNTKLLIDNFSFSGVAGFDFNSDGSKFYIIKSPNLYEYSLTVPYELYSGYTNNGSVSVSSSAVYSLSIVNNDSQILINAGGYSNLGIYDFITPGYLLGGLTNYNVLEFSHYVIGLSLSPDLTKIYISGFSGDIRQYSTNYIAGPLPGSIELEGLIIEQSNGIGISGFKTTKNANVSFAFENETTGETYIDESPIYFAGGVLNSMSWINDYNWTFEIGNTYQVTLFFDFGETYELANYWIDYQGFVLNYGDYEITGTGFLLKNINLTSTGTYYFNITNNNLGTRESIIGQYSSYIINNTLEVDYGKNWLVNTEYTIDGFFEIPGFSLATMHPYTFESITIDIGKSTSFGELCENGSADTGFLPGLSNFFYCSIDLLLVGVRNIDTAYSGLREFFNALGNIGNVTEKKELFETFNFNFQLIPSVNATETYEYSVENDPLAIISQGTFENIPLLNNIYNLVKYTILFGVFAMLMIYFFKPENKNG